MKSAIHFFGVALICSLFIGCGGGEKIPELAEVKGTVVANGKPLSGVKVTFMPEPESGGQMVSPQPSSAVTDDNGKFTLMYDNKKDKSGAAVGKHRVLLDDVTHHESRENPQPFRFNQELVNAGSTPLSEEVKSGDNDITIDISKYMK